MRSFLLPALSLALLAPSLGACSKKAADTDTTSPTEVAPAEADATTAEGKPAEAKPAEANPTEATPTEAKTGTDATGACTEYATALCKEAGEQSDTCGAIKTVVGGLLPAAACEAGAKDIEYTRSKLGDLKKVCTELTEKLCKDLGETTATCAMVKEQTPNFPTERCQSFMQQYDAVLADLKRMEAKNQPLTDELKAELVAGGVSAGSAESKVKVVEFSDFECPFCSRAADTINKLKADYGDRIHVVFRQYPLDFHKNAHLAHQAALAANAEGKFWEFHDKLFQNQRALSREDLEKYATELGLDMDKFKGALDAGTYKAEVDADIALGGKVGVDGTPTLFINGKRAGNPGDVDGVKAMIDAELNAAP